MTEKEKKLIAYWQEQYRRLYALAPEGFLVRLDPVITALDPERQTLTLRFRTDDWMANPRKIVHGGVIASMADTAMGLLSRVCAGNVLGGPTVSLSINYIRPVPLGTEVFLRTACKKMGRQILFLTCEGYLEAAPEEALFTAESCYMPGQGTLPEK